MGVPGAEVITDWDGDLNALNHADAVLVAPATRDVLASHLHGLQHGPLMMALSVARTRNTPVMMIPVCTKTLPTIRSPTTSSTSCRHRMFTYCGGQPRRENGRHAGRADCGTTRAPGERPPTEAAKHCGHPWSDTPHPSTMYATCKTRAAAQPAGRSPIIFITSRPRCDLRSRHSPQHLSHHGYRWSFPVQLRKACSKSVLALANDPIGAWVHAAAVLDYVVAQPAEGKLASQQGTLNVALCESKKRIMELKERCTEARSESGSNSNPASNKA